MKEIDVLIVGAGFAGSVTARVLAEQGKYVRIIEKRNHIGGNAYDYLDENQVMCHRYGPHIFHTNFMEVVDFLSRFTQWYPYEHKVLGYIEGKLVPIPFNLTSIENLFSKEKAERLKQLLVSTYGMEKKVPILELRKSQNAEIQELAEYIYEHVFKYYTMKQWGYSAEEIDPKVTGRVPVSISYDARYFQDTFQKMPCGGFTHLFEEMLNHPNIEVQLHTDSHDVLEMNREQHKMFYEGEVFEKPVVYTGLVDHLFNYSLGHLPYRSLEFALQSKQGQFQPTTTVNYPTPASQHAYTRISEYKQMMEQPPRNTSTIAIEYPYPYQYGKEKGNEPYYPLFTQESQKKYNAYLSLAKTFSNLYLLGRLAQYRYYNMDAITLEALRFSASLMDK